MPDLTPRQTEYRRYLKGRIWKAIRGAAIFRAGGKCARCDGTADLHVHHLTYPAVFGAETPEMLQVLCDPCHAEAHGKASLTHKLDKQRRSERAKRLKGKAKAGRDQKRILTKARRARRSAPYILAPTPSLKDRF